MLQKCESVLFSHSSPSFCISPLTFELDGPQFSWQCRGYCAWGQFNVTQVQEMTHFTLQLYGNWLLEFTQLGKIWPLSWQHRWILLFNCMNALVSLGPVVVVKAVVCSQFPCVRVWESRNKQLFLYSYLPLWPSNAQPGDKDSPEDQILNSYHSNNSE